ncbi:kinase-like domain-containing protein [Rhizophagus diaphanus]|nr:kinase-like domain-containing protein [Rhizophagus diaphanus] [Rhizophagus sp. MUCL 43196]
MAKVIYGVIRQCDATDGTLKKRRNYLRFCTTNSPGSISRKTLPKGFFRLLKRIYPELRHKFQLKGKQAYTKMEEYYAERLNGLLRDKIIDQYDSRDLINSKIIGFGGSASVYVANWKNTSTMYAIKKSVNNKEVCLTFRANSHENIIQFRGVTKLKDEKKYSLILEYADGGTLGKYLRNNTIEWKNQLRFAKEIASAICWLHDTKKIVHGDLHPNNILVHKDAVKLADFGRSCLKGPGCYNTQVWGVVPYVDPKMLNQKIPYKINEKSDIYSLGVIFWELTSRSSPFDGLEGDHIIYKILSGVREEPVPNTNVKFIRLYQSKV